MYESIITVYECMYLRIDAQFGVSLELKLRVYVAGVVSVLVYGCECWDMEWAVGAVGAWNARRLAVLTDREIRSEYLEPSLAMT